MSDFINDIRVENLKILLEIHGISARKLSLAAGLTADRIGYVLKGRFKLSEDLARTLEIALDVPPKMLDQPPSQLLESKAAVQQERVCSINTFLGENRFVDRYWNVRDLMEKSGMRPVEFATKTGFHTVDCSFLLSKNPTTPISDSRARIIEAAFGLDPQALDQRNERNTLAAPQSITKLSPEAIDILGTGVYLNRHLNIKNYFMDNHLTYNQVDSIEGFKVRASDKLADPPKSVIDTDSARAFERHYNLESGAVDQFIPDFDYAAHQSSFIIGEQAFNFVKTGLPLYRYVNTRRSLQERGIALIEFVPMMERTRAYVYAVLSDSVVGKIGDQTARRIERVLGLKPESLDVQRTFRVAKASPSLRQKRDLSQETEFQP
jgi:plasmid maintenance system antidote protein VapI